MYNEIKFVVIFFCSPTPATIFGHIPLKTSCTEICHHNEAQSFKVNFSFLIFALICVNKNCTQSSSIANY
jgi:hypothetical protein